MRKFTLENNTGASYDMTSKGNSFFYGVSGLGYDEDITFQEIGNRFREVESKFKQGVVNGSIKFWNPNVQIKYKNFVLFCQDKPLKLIYEVEGKTYIRRGYVSSVKFAEENCLRCDIEFTATTSPYEIISVVTYPSSGDTTGYGKKYNYSYPYRYNSVHNNSVMINSDSYSDSPCKLTMFGPLVNPQWTHYVNNVEFATGKITGTIPSGNRLVVDTQSLPYSIKQYDTQNNLVSDMYQSSDFGTDRFISLQYGANMIAIGDDGSNSVIVQAEGLIEYASV